MALEFAIGVPLPNNRFIFDSDNDGVPDGYVATDTVTCTHTYDNRGYGVVRVATDAGVTAGDNDNYIMCRTPVIGFHDAVQFRASVATEGNDGSTKYRIRMIGQPSGDVCINSSATTSSGGTKTMTSVASLANEGTSGDTYYEVYLHVDDGGAGDWIEFSHSLTLGHAFVTNNYRYALSGGIAPLDQADFYIQDFTDVSRDGAANSHLSNGTAGIDKYGLSLPLEYLTGTDLEFLRQLWRHTRGSPGLYTTGRLVVVNYTSLPTLASASSDSPPHTLYNPGYYRWIDSRWPFGRMMTKYFPSDPRYQGVMTLEEP